MVFKKYLILAIALLTISSIAFAGQTGGIKGTVTDKDAGVTLPGANVFISSPVLIQKEIATVTNMDGKFVVTNLPPGKYEVKVQMMGYSTQKKQEVQIIPDRFQQVNFELVIEDVKVEIVVEETQEVISKETTSQGTTFTRDEIEQRENEGYQGIVTDSAGNTGSDVSVGGVGIEGVGHEGIHIRGGDSNETGMYVDGGNMTDQITGTWGANINTDTIESVEVIAGGYQAEYGNAMSGIVNLVTKSGSDEYHGSVRLSHTNGIMDSDRDYVINSIDLYAEGPLIRSKMWFTFSLAYFTYQWEPDFGGSYKENYMDQLLDVSGYSASAKLTYQFSPNDKLVFNINHEDSEWDGLEPYNPDEFGTIGSQQGQYLQLAYTKVFSVTTFMESRLTYNSSILESDPKNVDKNIYAWLPDSEESGGWAYAWISGGPTIWSNEYRHSYSFDVNVNTLIGENHQLKSGIEVRYATWDLEFFFNEWYEIWYVYQGDPNTSLFIKFDEVDENIDLTSYTFYLQDSWSILDVVNLNLGLRYDYEDFYSNGDVAPRVGLSYYPTEKLAVKFNYGWFYQPPRLFQVGIGIGQHIYLSNHNSSDPYNESNYRGSFVTNAADDLESELTQAVELGFDYQIGDFTSFTLTAYYKIRDNLIGEVDTLPADTYGGNYVYTNDFSGTVFGAEVKLKKSLSDSWQGSLNYTFLQTSEEIPYDDPRQGDVTRVVDTVSDYDQTHTFTSSLIYNLPFDITVSGIFRFGSGYPYTLAFIDEDGYTRNEEPNQERLDPTHSLDLKIEKDFVISGDMKLKFWINMTNVYNQENVAWVNPLNGEAVYYEEGFTPEFGLKFSM